MVGGCFHALTIKQARQFAYLTSYSPQFVRTPWLPSVLVLRRFRLHSLYLPLPRTPFVQGSPSILRTVVVVSRQRCGHWAIYSVLRRPFRVRFFRSPDLFNCQRAGSPFGFPFALCIYHHIG